ncbi:MAG TPA: serine/threonine-protein kinase [Pirellulales bacterium]|nr:serine/threonine-protein kinase [Pirellulales bacterium]
MIESSRPSLPPAEPATVALNALVERADALLAAWQGDDLPPDLSQFLPAEPPALRSLTLIELIKIDLEYRWQHHELPKQVEEYVEEFPELASAGEIPCELICEEYRVRRLTADPPRSDEYYTRFPRQANRLKRMLAIDPNRTASTTLLTGARDPDFEVGQQIDDFDLLVRLGKGSFGLVFLARQRSMQRLVALKISRNKGAEPQTLAQLDHPHIVRVYDQRLLPDKRMQLMYMQHIPGGTLQDVLELARQQAPALRSGKTVVQSIDQALERHGESPPSESGARRRMNAMTWPEAVCWLGARLAAALEYAHQRGVLHRDVKPANVLLAADGAPKLVDFNVSYGSKLEGATAAAFFGGSPAYMSPEQIEAYNPDHDRKPDELDGRSDVYSLGVVLWEMLTGSRPFVDDRPEDCINDTPKLLARLTQRRQAGLTAVTLATLPPDLPPGLQSVLTACLSPNVKDRPASAGLLQRQLELCLKPRVQRLLRPSPGSLRQRLRRWPFWFFVCVGLMPSVIFSGLNLRFNSIEFIPLPDSPSNTAIHDFFWDVEVPVVNAVSFPIAVLLVFYVAWPVLIAVGRVGSGKQIPPEEHSRLRRRALWVGDSAAWVGMALWVISGIVFPAWQHLHFGDIEGIGFDQYRNFLASQIVCGWISSTLTFYLLTFMFVRAFYPVLVRPEQTNPSEVDHLERVGRRCGWGLYLTLAAPFCAVGLLAVSGLKEDSQKIWMGALAIIGLGVTLLSYYILQLIRTDLAALEVAIDPSRDATSVSTDTVDSLWTGTR